MVTAGVGEDVAGGVPVGCPVQKIIGDGHGCRVVDAEGVDDAQIVTCPEDLRAW